MPQTSATRTKYDRDDKTEHGRDYQDLRERGRYNTERSGRDQDSGLPYYERSVDNRDRDWIGPRPSRTMMMYLKNEKYNTDNRARACNYVGSDRDHTTIQDNRDLRYPVLKKQEQEARTPQSVCEPFFFGTHVQRKFVPLSCATCLAT